MNNNGALQNSNTRKKILVLQMVFATKFQLQMPHATTFGTIT